jgi:hypothetical protein
MYLTVHSVDVRMDANELGKIKKLERSGRGLLI